MSLGMLLLWTIAYFCPWRTTAYFAMIPPALFAFLMIFLPESPYWLIEDNNYEAAR